MVVVVGVDDVVPEYVVGGIGRDSENEPEYDKVVGGMESETFEG